MLPLSNNTLGILWALLAAALYAAVAAMAKVAVESYHVLQILFFQQVVVFTLSMPALIRNYPEGLKTRFPGLHAIRLGGAFVALACGIWAVELLPLTTAITLGFTQGFFIIFFAITALGERVGLHRIGAVVVGFVGVSVIMRPAADGVFDSALFVPLTAALGAALAVVAVRKLSQTESTATLLVYQSTFVGLLSGVPLLRYWVTPSFADTLFLLAIGLIAAAGQWAGIRALRAGEASVVGGMQYSQLIFAALLGFVLFDEVPDRNTLIGSGIIILSAVYLLYRESRHRDHR
ncbi:MAG: DMT family transporter [Pseudomonadota bacterium]